MTEKKMVLVLGATGQQGGATARALQKDGWNVRALLRDPSSAKARALAGVEVVRGDYGDAASLDAAMAGAYGVYSMQASSGSAQGSITDDDERRAGIAIADAAGRAKVKHFVYASQADLKPNTGVGHFESKWQIEEHIRKSDLPATIVRPGGFMELMLEPWVGLSQGNFFFFTPPEQPFQIIASDDIGRLVATVFAAPERHLGQTLEIAADEVTGPALAAGFARVLGKPVAYSRFPKEMRDAVPMLQKITDLVDRGGLSPRADIAALRKRIPDLLTFETWLDKNASAIRNAVSTPSK
jgi:uncharacterized protein YbjT (DUF2867 family)